MKRFHEWTNRLFDWINRKSMRIGQIPQVMLDRVVKTATLSFFILILGCFMGIYMKSTNFIVFSIILSGLGFFSARKILRAAETKLFVIIEGTVVKIKGRHAPGRFYTIQLQISETESTELLLTKNDKVTPGRAYRFYFSNNGGPVLGLKKIDAKLNTNSFFGFEEI